MIQDRKKFEIKIASNDANPKQKKAFPAKFLTPMFFIVSIEILKPVMRVVNIAD
jgi:hypothetical protein